MEGWWADLEKEEATASRALLNLADHPKDSVAFLKRKLKPLKIEAEQVKALIEKLGSDDPEVWKPAFEELEYFDPRLAIDLVTLMNDVVDMPARTRMVEVMSGREPDSLEGQLIELRATGADDAYNFLSQNIGSWWAEYRVGRLNSSSWLMTKKKWIRAVRAIVLLEHIASPDAVVILKEMGTGHPDAQPTKSANDALERITKKPRG